MNSSEEQRPKSDGTEPTDDAPQTSKMKSLPHLWRQHVTRGRAMFTAVGGAIIALGAWYDDVITKVLPVYDRYSYGASLQPPYDKAIEKKTIDQMTSGEAGVALMRIDGYLGNLKDDKIWKQLCASEAANDEINKESTVSNSRPSVFQTNGYLDRLFDDIAEMEAAKPKSVLLNNESHI
jgi:hypothetical protein